METSIAFEEPRKKETPTASDSPQVPGDAAIQLVWPTDYRVVTLPFAANPELFARRGLPGHEGLDLRAPHDSPVYAAADGRVTVIQERIANDDAYGRWVRIEHSDGYISLYAHLSRVMVSIGAKVKAGQVIGYAGATGETAGGHIHFGLMRRGASNEQLTHYPDDIIDPTPFFFASPAPRINRIYPWPLGRCLPGVTMDEKGDNPSLGAIKPEAAKLPMHATREQIVRIRKQIPDAFLLTALSTPMLPRPLAPREWVARVRSAMKAHVEAGVAYFEVQPSPNLAASGAFTTWESGRGFAHWWVEATNLLREIAPHAKFGFPGLANGPQAAGQRMDAQIFMEHADEAMLVADWIGVQAYWNNSAEANDETLGARYRLMRRWYPHKLFFITEFANTDPLVNLEFKIQEYATFLTNVQNDSGIAAAFLAPMLSLE